MTEKQIPEAWNWQKRARSEADLIARTAVEKGWFDGYNMFSEMGTGKTRAATDILRDRFNQEKRVMRTLVMAPQAVLEAWRRQLLKFSNINPEKILVLDHKLPDRRKKLFEQMKAKNPTGFICIVNYDKVRYTNKKLGGTETFHMLEDWHPEIYVSDEIHCLKDRSAKQTKAAIRLVDGQWDKKTETWLRRPVRHRYGMTGTPIANDLTDIWALYRVIDGGQTFGNNYFIFLKTYFYDKNEAFKGKKGYYPDWKVKPGMEPVFNELIYRKAIRVLKEECLDLPPLIRKQVFVEMGAEQERLYKEMKRDFVAYLEGEHCVATMALTKALRMQEIVSGYMPTMTGRKMSLEDNPRAKVLKDLLAEICPRNKCIVWAHFSQNYEQIRNVCQELGLAYTEIHGETSIRTQDAVDRFRDDPECLVAICNPGSGGTGTDLTKAAYAIYFSRDFSRIKDEQSRARNHRAGSEVHERIIQIDLVCRGTTDETTLQCLEDKVSISEAVLAWRDRV